MLIERNSIVNTENKSKIVEPIQKQYDYRIFQLQWFAVLIDGQEMDREAAI